MITKVTYTRRFDISKYNYEILSVDIERDESEDFKSDDELMEEAKAYIYKHRTVKDEQ